MATKALSGDLTMQEVPATWRNLAADLPDEIDLSGLGRIDSSALALLLECQASANAAGRRIQFHNPPETLRTIARLTQVEELLGWNTSIEGKGTPA
jgi:phospholipid transport system transporter-binding protein